MSRALKRRLALGVAIIALVSGGAIASVSATGQDDANNTPGAAHWRAHHHSEELLGTAASYLGLSPSELRLKLGSGETLAQIATATPGKSDEGLVDALVATRKLKLEGTEGKLRQRVRAAISRPLVGTRAARQAAGQGAHAAALQYLGLSPSQLHGRLRSGKTLARIAQSTPGKSEAGLIEAIITAKRVRLDAAVSAGKLTSSAESADLARMRDRIKAAVDHLHVMKKTG